MTDHTSTLAPSDSAARFVGQSVVRTEDARLVAGRGRYVDDLVLPGMLHAAFVRSDVARAEITRLDVDAARQLPGVHAVYTAADYDPIAGEMYSTMTGPSGPRPPTTPLGRDARFVGDVLAIVVAASRSIAEDACELVEVDYDVRPAIVDSREAVTSSDFVHPERGTNVSASMALEAQTVDDVVAGRDDVELVTANLEQQRQTNSPMETRGIVASYDAGPGTLTIWISTQHPQEVKHHGARVAQLDVADVRVIMPDVGGGFGQKIMMTREDASVILATRLLGRPVKWIEDRRESLMASNHARDEKLDTTIAATRDGTMLGIWLDHIEDVGAYPLGGSGSTAFRVGLMLPGPYRFATAGYRNHAVFTNTCGRGAYRGPWMGESLAREIMVDKVARRTGIDPLELRRRNVIQPSELPYTTATGQQYVAISPSATLEQAAALVGYEQFRSEQVTARGEGRYVGLGISLFIEPTGGGPGIFGKSFARVRMEPDGTVRIMVAAGNHGQGLETTMAQIVADELGVDVGQVVYAPHDTDVIPYSFGTGGSRSAVVVGGATHVAAQRAREKLLTIAAHVMEAAPEDLELAAGNVSVRGTPSSAMPIAEIARRATYGVELPPGMDPGITAEAWFDNSVTAWANACHMCVCEVDADTGQVRILRYIVSEDCGKMINPMIVEGQVSGGVVQGIGGVLDEHVAYDEAGTPLATTFLDYLLPSATEIPLFEIGHLETPAPQGYGYKGTGEGGAIGAPAAVVNAVADALTPFGVEIDRLPLGPDEVLTLLEAARAPA